jgi:hypothetical protein
VCPVCRSIQSEAPEEEKIEPQKEEDKELTRKKEIEDIGKKVKTRTEVVKTAEDEGGTADRDVTSLADGADAVKIGHPPETMPGTYNLDYF